MDFSQKLMQECKFSDQFTLIVSTLKYYLVYIEIFVYWKNLFETTTRAQGSTKGLLPEYSAFRCALLYQLFDYCVANLTLDYADWWKIVPIWNIHISEKTKLNFNDLKCILELFSILFY